MIQPSIEYDKTTDTAKCLWHEQLHQSDVNGNQQAVAGPSTASMTWAELEAMKTAKANPLRKALVLWTAPQNTQVVDATIRTRKMLPGAKVLHINNWKAELAALLEAIPHLLELIMLDQSATSTDRAIVKLINNSRMIAYAEGNLNADPYSIAGQSRKVPSPD
jgi:hypothetical protein